MTDAIGAAAHLTAAPDRRGSAVAMRLRAASEYLVIPVAAVAVAAALFVLFLLSLGKSPSTFVDLLWSRLRLGLLLGQHAEPRGPPDPDRADGGDPGPARLDDHRR